MVLTKPQGEWIQNCSVFSYGKIKFHPPVEKITADLGSIFFLTNIVICFMYEKFEFLQIYYLP